MNEFYVYKHVTIDTQEIFYVGKGKGRRAFEKRSRNAYWKNVAKGGFRVEFLATELPEQEALKLEKAYIEQLNPKCNLTKGGQGTAGYKFSAETVRARNLANKARYNDKAWVETRNNSLRQAMANPKIIQKLKDFQQLRRKEIAAGKRPKPRVRTISEAERKLISERQKGDKGFWYNKTTVVAKPVSNLTTGESFVSVKAAAESVGGKYRGLSKAIRAGRNFKGHLFKFKE